MKTTGVDILQQMLMSPPSRRRGLKIVTIKEVVDWIEVASFAEAWIEKTLNSSSSTSSVVASFAEAWIENFIVRPGL